MTDLRTARLPAGRGREALNKIRVIREEALAYTKGDAVELAMPAMLAFASKP